MDNRFEPELREAPAVLARFRRALNLSFVALIVLGAMFWAQQQWPALSGLAIHPHDPAGLVGVLMGPLLHGSIDHLINNSISILVLGTLAGTVFPRATVRALPLLWLGSGLGTWILATDGWHLGASGVTHGLGFLVFTLAALRRDRPAIAAGLIAFFFYGGMLLTVLPQELGVSWEYHLSGALMGVLAGVLWRRADPEPPRRRYSWEDEAEDDPDEDDDLLELPRPGRVPVLWRRPPDVRGRVIPFRPRDPDL